MKTGIEGVKFGIVLYTLPYFFVYNNGLLFMGGFTKIVLAVILATGGIFALAIAAQNYFLKPLNKWIRILFLIASILIFIPRLFETIIGYFILIISLFYLNITNKKGKLKANEEIQVTN